MDDTPCIDVIVPVYKVEEYLPICMQSLLSQDCESFVVTLVDDGSPDGCGALCDEYAQKDGRVRVIHQENTGQATARNRAVARSDARFITFVDADDHIAPGYLSALYAAAERTGADVAVARICTETPRPDGSVSHDPYPLPEKLVMERDEALQALCLEQISGISGLLCGKLIRRQLVLEHPFPEGRLFEDSYAIWRQFMDSRCVVCAPEAVYYYFQRPGSSQHKAFEPRHMDLIDAVKDMMAVFEARQLPRPVLDAGAFKTCRSCYVTAYHAADLPYRQFRAVCAGFLPLLRQYLPAARATGRMDLKLYILYGLMLWCRPLFYLAARLHG